MKLIDLMQMYVNKEVLPKGIIIRDHQVFDEDTIWEHRDNTFYCREYNGDIQFLFEYIVPEMLNDEVGIIEDTPKEDKKILEDKIKELEEENEKLRKLCDSRYKYGSNIEGKYVVAQTKLDAVAQYLLDHSLNFNGEIETDLEIEEVKDLYHYIKTGDWDRDRGDLCE